MSAKRAPRAKPYKAVAFDDRYGPSPYVVEQAAFGAFHPALKAVTRFAKVAGSYGERHVSRIVITKRGVPLAECTPKITRHRGPARTGRTIRQHAKCVLTAAGRKALKKGGPS